MLRPALICLSERDWAERSARAAGIERLLVRRFVAGDARADALAMAQWLSQTGDGVHGANANFSFLGEAVTDPAEAEQAVAEYCALAAAIGAASELDARVGVKPTLLGLGISHQTAERGLLTIVETAAERGVRIELDMEASDTVDAMLELYRAAAARPKRTGVALQACLRRTPDDAQALIDEGIARLRLVNDLPTTGYWEYQMLYGVRPQLGAAMRACRERPRMSIPYGERWYPYLMRRIFERPSNALFAVRAVIGR